ncbi:hypothetical protein XENOCAPTIV_018059 [Xenoophorus captivus]|uniref:DUF6729 domain-containing protein n=1 Tax=Xenoophorus captivus TaxID=1517983 RepID=A0ABV0RJ68_9TELE
MEKAVGYVQHRDRQRTEKCTKSDEPEVYNQPPAYPGPFFTSRLFLWMPHRIWRLQLTCPQPSCTGSMTKAGLYRTIRRVLDIDGWYLMATEYLECRRCKKKVGGWLSCDQKVVAQLRSRTLGNSATQLYNSLREQHTESWMRRSIHYLGVCEQFLSLGSVTKKLAGAASDTAAWVTNVGNEHGQVLMSILTCSEGSEGLDAMAARLMGRFYPTFMKQLPHCIFEVDSGDARRLTDAKRSDLWRKHGMVDLSDAEVVRRISKEEWRLAAYTGELIGLEYLFRQMGSMFEEINLDPDAPDEGAAEEIQGPDRQPGYQHVLKLAKALVEVRSLNGLSERRVDRIILL